MEKEKIRDSILLKDGIYLKKNILTDLDSNRQFNAYEIFKDNEFQLCFLREETYSKLSSDVSNGTISYDEFQNRLSEIAENTIKKARNILD